MIWGPFPELIAALCHPSELNFFGHARRILLRIDKAYNSILMMSPPKTSSLPRMFQGHTLAEAAAEVEKDFPTHFPTELVKTFLGEGVTFNDNVIPRVGSDFVNSQVMLARLIGWAVSVVSPTAFGAKWHEGRARPEEIAWMIATRDENVNAPADVETDISNLGLADQYAFTAYTNGSPKHPSWPAMHSAASSASLYLAVVLNLDELQTAEAIALDCAVASFRTFAGVHYESDNLAGLSIGQEVIRRELPGCDNFDIVLVDRPRGVPARSTPLAPHGVRSCRIHAR